MYPINIPEKYDPSNLENLGHRFTTVHLGNYIKEDRREYVGSHPGVDIIPLNPNQDVFCVLDGKVLKVGDDGAYGLFVNIEHENVPDPDDLSKKITIVSCYLHLDKIKIKEGDKIKKGTKIGVTGNTGMSYGEHLHFQIDRKEAPYHAFWPYSGADIRKAGISFLEGVNKGLGLDNAKKLTINPLLYLDNLEKIGNIHNNIDDEKEVNIKPESKVSTENESVKSEDKIDNTLLSLSGKKSSENSDSLEKVIKEEKTIINNEDKDSSTNTKSVDDWLSGVKEKKSFNNDNSSNNLESKKEIKKEPKKVEKLEKIEDEKNDVVVNSSDSLLASISNDIKKSDKTKVFKDINTTDNLFYYLRELYDKGIVKGYDDGTFRPNNPITRAEFLKLIFEVKGVILSNDKTDYFLDVNSNTWQKSYINTGVKLGLITTSNKEFRPNSFISRVEALKIVIMLFEGGQPNISYNNKYLDVNSDLWYAPFVAYSDNKNLIITTNNNFYPDKNITRREIVSILMKLTK